MPDDLLKLAERLAREGRRFRTSAEKVTDSGGKLRIDLTPQATDRIGAMMIEAANALRARSAA